MINVSISPDGEIVISQETPGERIYMGEHYARMDREAKDQHGYATLSDDERAAMFKQGWESAIRESQLQYVNGRIEDFWNDMGVGGKDPHHDEPEGTGEETDTWPPRELDDDPEMRFSEEEVAAFDPPLIRSVADSGEPEKENDLGAAFKGLDGVWTISNEELQSRLDAEFERGVSYVSPTVPRRYSQQEIAELSAEAYGQGIADSGKPRTIKFSALRGIADRVASEPRPDDQPANLETLLRRVAEELGYEVTR